MEQISDERLPLEVENLDKWEWDRLTPQRQTLKMALNELKERRAADEKPRTVKDQLRLVRDKCPDGFEIIKYSTCPRCISEELHDMEDICPEYKNRDVCEKCWNEALDGEG